jgi:hypothetical protein
VRLLAVLAQVTADPDPSFPGGEFVGQIINWLTQIALWGSLASMLVGAALWGLSQMAGNPYGSGQGQKLALGGGIGAALAALAATFVNDLFTAAGG